MVYSWFILVRSQEQRSRFQFQVDLFDLEAMTSLYIETPEKYNLQQETYVLIVAPKMQKPYRHNQVSPR